LNPAAVGNCSKVGGRSVAQWVVGWYIAAVGESINLALLLLLLLLLYVYFLLLLLLLQGISETPDE
jgi:hypothetical protein